MTDVKWDGPECWHCNGTGVTPIYPNPVFEPGKVFTTDFGEPVWIVCPTCNGHGRLPS